MASKKHNSGEGNPFAKLTAAQVAELRSLRQDRRKRYPRGHPLSLAVLAERFGVRPSQLSRIILGHAWQHLP